MRVVSSSSAWRTTMTERLLVEDSETCVVASTTAVLILAIAAVIVSPAAALSRSVASAPRAAEVESVQD